MPTPGAAKGWIVLALGQVLDVLPGLIRSLLDREEVVEQLAWLRENLEMHWLCGIYAVRGTLVAGVDHGPQKRIDGLDECYWHTHYLERLSERQIARLVLDDNVGDVAVLGDDVLTVVDSRYWLRPPQR